MNRVELKTNAKSSLQGKWGEAILLMIIMGAIFFAISCVSMIGGGTATYLSTLNNDSGASMGFAQILSYILQIIASATLTLGSVSFYLKLSRNEAVTFKELFSKANLWLLFIGVSIMTAIFTTLWSLLFIIPGIIATYRYAMVNYIMIDNPELGVLGSIRRSKEIMYGHKLDYFVLQLSFIGWLLLSVLTCGLLLFYVTPYMSVTTANFYNSIKDGNNNNNVNVQN